jgi:hypothetical protein
MKASLRDHLSILMAFAAVFLCGFGIGHLVAGRQVPTAPAAPDQTSWEASSLAALTKSLQLEPAELQQVEKDLALTAAQIEETRASALLSYHQHLDALYGRLIEQLDEPRAARLRREKIELESAIQKLKALHQ